MDKPTPRTQAVLAVTGVATGLALQVVTHVALLEDAGLAAVVGGLGALAIVVPALVAGAPPADGDADGVPPPRAPR